MHESAPQTPKGMAALATVLPADKARLARRLWAAGGRPTRSDFDERGITLSDQEWSRLDDWLQRGMTTSVVEEVASRDGSVRLGIGLHDGRRVETVAMPVGAACVSSQVGCAVGCRFCASGMFGVERNLTATEILEQVVHARRRMRIDRVVFMGMGEPGHNLDAVLQSVEAIKDVALIGPKKQTLSTVGSVRTIGRMDVATVRPCLAISLHLADDVRRQELLPRAPKEPVADIVAAADAYGRSIGMPIQFEWTMLAGVNDRDEDADAVIELLAGVRGYLNCIVWNPVAELPFAAPSRERIVEFVRRVKRGGVLATIRDSAGPDAEAACGQLRLRQQRA
jgi:23S rRNA (adenine2503-C2)-methyltransferase